MSRKFIATVLAASLAITGFSASQARALSERDLAALLFGAVAIGIVGAAINDRSGRDRVVTHGYDNWGDGYERRPTQKPKPRPLPHRASRKQLPAKCLRAFETRRGTVRMYTKRCLKNNFRFYNRLPQVCRTTVRANHKKRTGYTARCMRQQGYSLARR